MKLLDNYKAKQRVKMEDKATAMLKQMYAGFTGKPLPLPAGEKVRGCFFKVHEGLVIMKIEADSGVIVDTTYQHITLPERFFIMYHLHQLDSEVKLKEYEGYHFAFFFDERGFSVLHMFA